jgi:hypothetical protein
MSESTDQEIYQATMKENSEKNEVDDITSSSLLVHLSLLLVRFYKRLR